MMQNNENTRPTIEDEIKNAGLSGDLQKNALDFVAYLKECGMSVDETYHGLFRYYDESVCVIATYPIDNIPGWTIFWGDYDSTICCNDYKDFCIDEQVKEFAWSHANVCGHFTSGGKDCGCGSQPGKTVTILGKEFDNICTSLLSIRNPNAKTLEKVRKLAESWMQCIADANK